MNKKNEFQGLMEEARNTHSYRLEGAVLEFTEQMVARMDKLGVNRTELARRIDSSPAYITKILRGNTNFTLDSMVKIAHALGCTYRSHLEPEGCDSQWFGAETEGGD
ncbi:MAG: helix-turn-helix transcriptional regulator [Verrucomicrobia bacterium]|nr:helix-turn-helix transcriptional regulator [Verrucomicrobiota bacterium]MCH8512262.1 helix-turn-helix transcriptional regulator [Kiritimatiellia bacterium]